MARETLCAKIFNDVDLSCVNLPRKYFQQFVAINKSDIDSYTINKTDFSVASPVCEYSVEFTLKEGKKGFFFMLPQNGTAVFGTYDKTVGENLAVPQYVHNVSFFMGGASEQSKCILDALDKGSYVVALQLMDGTVEIYGIDNGLSTGDYTFDLQANGGGSVIVLSSNESTPEGNLPLVYKPQSGGDAGADFDSAFENTTP